METKTIIKNTLIYLMLVIGGLFLYYLDVDILLHPHKKVEAKSKVNFVYQQF